ncbi:type IV pilin N-terminal domain-containing protein [Methanocorpusculum sp. MG]|uniref:Type IV pilin N-terminal domain-containing protein n=1 Tax=Methanocorpusculum petauri TaxID=3002863 RepID=A0ABT4IE92_9EURY|nr:type IV pilin N-terminal domain-containing protein [Methanocorpusculum petauri]MCZ0860054.1 type IV pilin N-terminal domain-containing protein [Methanocorpusculum petauri]
MEYCLWLRGTSGTKNGLRIQNAAIKSRKTAVPAGDDGVAPVIAVAVLIGMVVVAGAIIGFAMFAAMEDAAGTLPDVRFQASADGVSLYHAGGDALPLKSLVFYNTETKENVSVQLTKCGSADSATPKEWDVWETGDKIRFGEEGVLGVLSIVCMDSRNRPALLWMGSRAMALPVGDMVPDVWGETSDGGETETIPLPKFPGEDTGDIIKYIHTNSEQQGVHLGDLQLIENDKFIVKPVYTIPSSDSAQIKASIKPQKTNQGHGNDEGHPYTTINVTIYALKDGKYIRIASFIATDSQGSDAVVVNVPLEKMRQGTICYVTIERGKNATYIDNRQTIVVEIKRNDG